MPFKINLSHNGKTYKLETENEILIGKKIGETFPGEEIDSNLKGYEILITGLSDLSGIPSFKGLEGATYHRKVLTKGPGMRQKRRGLRVKRLIRGEEISPRIHQINTKVIKEGHTKFLDLIKKEEKPAA